jgi:3-deoxy-manno-octulosonate cytidylyltransferase (CMP-KDO synthetase)
MESDVCKKNQFKKMQNSFIGIIPSRFASTRFPGKPLIIIDGKSMIERVYMQAKLSTSLSKVIVATDDERIFDHVKKFGGEVIMTSAEHQSGTDRCAEVVSNLKESFDVAINIQGDEPYIQPEQIDLICSCFNKDETQIATLIKQTGNINEIESPNVVKAVVAQNLKALYFSRHAIPFNRNNSDDIIYYKHIGIYAYRTAILSLISKLPVSLLERAESLEQLRWLENGFTIQTAITKYETIAIDTPADLEKLNFK